MTGNKTYFLTLQNRLIKTLRTQSDVSGVQSTVCRTSPRCSAGSVTPGPCEEPDSKARGTKSAADVAEGVQQAATDACPEKVLIPEEEAKDGINDIIYLQ